MNPSSHCLHVLSKMDNKFCWAGACDSDVPRGEKREEGARGEKREEGARGEKREEGARGEKREEGARGEKREEGARGVVLPWEELWT